MKPILLLTMGDVAGVGPEILARSWPHLVEECRPVVVGDSTWMRRALDLVGARDVTIREVGDLDDVETTAQCVVIHRPPTARLADVAVGQVSAAAGKAAYDFLCTAIDACLTGKADGIVTCPLHKEGLRAAGVPHPGHTEILAERTGAKKFAMVLLFDGLAVAHVTLHVPLRRVFDLLTTETIVDKIDLLDRLLPRLIGRRPRIGVAALNPHASDGGLFGDEEEQIIRPAVERSSADVTGPWPCDTLFSRARNGEFDGIVAMYHDQGHIALKLLGGARAVNVSAGLPIVRTSVAHGTAYDIAWRGVADAAGLLEAVRVAAKLARPCAASA
jgi:4-hydroxythreonine-4-phosphate dehydrogenase